MPSEETPPVSSTPDECDAEALAAEALNLKDEPAETSGVLEAEVDEATGITTATLDATLGGPAGAAASSWLYLDLLTGEIAPLSDTEALTSTDWHLAFKRTSIRVNGGQSGPRGVYVHAIDQDFDEVEGMPEVPRGAWITDDFVNEDCTLITEGRGTPATAFGIWYDYDFEIHTASAPEGVTWLVYSMDTHATWRLSIDSLSNNGVYALRWAPFRRE